MAAHLRLRRAKRSAYRKFSGNNAWSPKVLFGREWFQVERMPTGPVVTAMVDMMAGGNLAHKQGIHIAVDRGALPKPVGRWFAPHLPIAIVRDVAIPGPAAATIE